MAKTARLEFTPEKSDAAYKYLGLKREELISRMIAIVEIAAADADREHKNKYPNTTHSYHPNMFLGIPAAIPVRAHYEFNQYLDFLVFGFVYKHSKDQALRVVRATKEHGTLSIDALSEIGLIRPAVYDSETKRKNIAEINHEDLENIARHSSDSVQLHGRVSVVAMLAILNMTDYFARLPAKLPPEFNPSETEAASDKKPVSTAAKMAAPATTLRLTAKEDALVAAYRGDSVFRRRINRFLKALEK